MAMVFIILSPNVQAVWRVPRSDEASHTSALLVIFYQSSFYCKKLHHFTNFAFAFIRLDPPLPLTVRQTRPHVSLSILCADFTQHLDRVCMILANQPYILMKPET
jgi:hypothetical protein